MAIGPETLELTINVMFISIATLQLKNLSYFPYIFI